MRRIRSVWAVPRITDWHHEACRDGFFYPILSPLNTTFNALKKLTEVPEYAGTSRIGINVNGQCVSARDLGTYHACANASNKIHILTFPLMFDPSLNLHTYYAYMNASSQWKLLWACAHERIRLVPKSRSSAICFKGTFFAKREFLINVISAGFIVVSHFSLLYL